MFIKGAAVYCRRRRGFVSLVAGALTPVSLGFTPGVMSRGGIVVSLAGNALERLLALGSGGRRPGSVAADRA